MHKDTMKRLYTSASMPKDSNVQCHNLEELRSPSTNCLPYTATVV